MSVNSKRQIIFTATKEQLTCPTCYHHLWSTAVSLTHLSSGGWIKAIEELFRDLESLGIQVRHPTTGDMFIIPFIDDVFDDENEAGRRWVTNFRKADQTGTRSHYFCRCLLRLQSIELLLQCAVAKYRRGSDTPRCSCTHMPLGW